MAGMTNAKPTDSPLHFYNSLYEEKKTPTEKDKEAMRDIPYRKFLGSLLFLPTRIHPDLATTVSILGKHQQEPMVEHWKSMKSVVP